MFLAIRKMVCMTDTLCTEKSPMLTSDLNGILDVYRKLSYESIGLLYLKAVYGKMSYVIIG